MIKNISTRPFYIRYISESYNENRMDLAAIVIILEEVIFYKAVSFRGGVNQIVYGYNKTMTIDRELIIIGGGPAGLTAGIYAKRSGIDTLLIERLTAGGLVTTTNRIENYPGFPEPVTGAELIEKMKRQAKGFGLDIKEFTTVSAIEADDIFRISITNGEAFSAKTLIIATGSEPRDIKAPGAERLKGRGVSYCATCDGPFFKGQPVLVVGGGNAAIEEALYLTRFASRVYVVHRRDKLRADKILQERIFNDMKIEVLWNSVVHEIIGSDRVDRAVLENVQTMELSEVEVSGVFVYIGTVPNTAFLRDIVDMDKQGYIITDPYMRTSCPGIFAAGDCRDKRLRQIVTGVGEGATAAMMAYHYLEDIRR